MRGIADRNLSDHQSKACAAADERGPPPLFDQSCKGRNRPRHEGPNAAETAKDKRPTSCWISSLETESAEASL